MRGGSRSIIHEVGGVNIFISTEPEWKRGGATNQRWLINHVVGGWSQWRQSAAVPQQKERNVSLDSRQRRATRQSGRQYQSRGGLGTNGVRAERRMGKWSVFLARFYLWLERRIRREIRDLYAPFSWHRNRRRRRCWQRRRWRMLQRWRRALMLPASHWKPFLHNWHNSQTKRAEITANQCPRRSFHSTYSLASAVNIQTFCQLRHTPNDTHGFVFT